MPSSENYLERMQRYESFSPTAYEDYGQWSIGYGTRTDNPDEISGQVSIDEEEAYRRMEEWTEADRKYIVEEGAKNGLTFLPNELDALTSFTYNLGRGNLSKLISGRDKTQIADKIDDYNRAGGEILEGLVYRRLEEQELFETPYEEDLSVAVEPAQPADRSYLDYQEQGVPASILRADPSNAEEADQSLSDMWEAATYRNWIHNAVDRNQQEQGVLDPNYLVSMGDLTEFNDKGYNDQELEFLSQAVSPQNLQHRIDRINSDREAKAILEKGGMEGVGMEMLASVTDPSLLPSMFLGGIGAAAKFNSVKAIAGSMLNGASQNVAAEYLLKQGDTQRTDYDLMLAAAGGAVFSGVITSTALGVGSLRNRIRSANEIESENVTAIKEAYLGQEYNKADSALKLQLTNAVDRKRFLTEKEILGKLQESAGTRSETLSVKKVNQAKKDFREYRKQQEAKIERIKKTPMRKPSSKVKQVKQLEDSITRARMELDNLIEENNSKLLTNSRLDALQQGRIPDSMREEYETYKMQNAEYDFIEPTYRNASLPKRTEQPVPEEVEGAGGAESVQSMGAMQVRREFKDIATYDNLLPDSEIEEISEAVYKADTLGFNTPRVSRMASKARGFRSTSTILDSAPDNATRGMSIQLLKNGTRTIEGHQSAEEIADTLFHRNVPDYQAYEDAFDRYAKGQKLGILSKGRQALKQEFDNQIVLLQASGEVKTNKPSPEDSPLMSAAKARSRIYERSLGNNKQYGVIGFDNVEHSHSYHSVVYDASKVLSAKESVGGDTTVHFDRVVNTIAKAYEEGGIKLSRENAIRLANTQIARIFEYNHGGNGTGRKAMSESEYKVLDKELESKGIDITVREEIKSSLFNKEDLATMSPRAMFSLKPNLNAATGGLRMVDLIDTSMNRVMKYASDSSASAGLAKHGYRSRNQFIRAMEEARQQALNELRKRIDHPDKKVAESAQSELAKVNDGYYASIMEDAVKLMYREPITSASDSIEDLSKILRKQTSITRLRSTGLMSIPEYAIAAARNGGLSVLKSLPQARYFDLRSQSVAKDKFMNDFAQTFSATGHQEYLFGAKFYNNSDFDDATKTKLGNLINNVQGKMMNVTMTVNAFRTFQHGGEEMVARSIVGNLRDMAAKGEITSNVRRSLIKVGGLSEDQVEGIINHFKANPTKDVFDSVRTMDPDLYNSLSVAVRNTIGSSFMRMGIGESVPYANRELGKIMTTLLNFTIGSWEKMVVRGIKSDGLGLMAAMFAGQAALAVMAQYAYVYSRAMGMEGNDRIDFINKNLEDEGLFWGVANRVGYLAAPMLPMQMLASARLLPEEISASPTKAGVNSMGIPSVDMGSDYMKAFGSTGEMISNQFSDDYMSNEEKERNLNNIRRVLPWVDSPVYNAATLILD